MMMLRSRFYKRFLVSILIGAIFLLTLNTQLSTLQISEILNHGDHHRANRAILMFESDTLAADDETVISHIKGRVHPGASAEDPYNLTERADGDKSRVHAWGLEDYFKRKVIFRLL